MKTKASRSIFQLAPRFEFLIFAVAGALTVFSAWSMSYVYNENGRLASGLIYLETGDYSAFHVNPPLVSLVGALPAALGGAERPTRAELGIGTFVRDEYRAGTLFDEKNPNNRLFLFAGRLCCIVLVFIGLWSTFRFARAIFGVASGRVFLWLAAFSPFTLGMGALIVPDVASAFWGAAAVFLFWRWLRSPSADAAFLAGCALGAAEATKFTLLVFYPLFPILWLICRRGAKRTDGETETRTPPSFRRELAQLVLLLAVSVFFVNACYAFEGTGKQLRTFKFQTAALTGRETYKDVPLGGANRFDGSGNRVETALGYLPSPFPKNFVQGIDTQRLDFERGLESYLRGEFSEHGWLHYYLYALLVKVPTGALCLFVLATICAFCLKGYGASWRDEAVVLAPGVVLLAFVSSQTGFSVHSRYVIPALPFFAIWTSRLGRAFSGVPCEGGDGDSASVARKYPQGYKTARVLTVVFLTWAVGSSLSIYPSSIAYFNELAVVIPTPKNDERPPIPTLPKPKSVAERYKAIVSAGPRNGPRHLLDSNVDWGQDLFRLERWIQKRPEIETIDVAYWGSGTVESTTIPTSGSFGAKLKPGWYALSVNYLFSSDGHYEIFRDFAPVDTVGCSIYIYNLTQEEIDAAEARRKRRVESEEAEETK